MSSSSRPTNPPSSTATGSCAPSPPTSRKPIRPSNAPSARGKPTRFQPSAKPSGKTPNSSIRKLNDDRAELGKQRIAVNTYLLVNSDLNDDEQQTMKQIADENGGRYIYVKAVDLIP
jgi:hypothetical protein